MNTNEEQGDPENRTEKLKTLKHLSATTEVTDLKFKLYLHWQNLNNC